MGAVRRARSRAPAGARPRTVPGVSDDAWATRFDDADPVHRAVDELVSTALADGGYVGVAAALVEDGRTVLARGWGRTSAGDGAGEVSPGTLFAFGSISKTLTALLVLRLREQGLLDLDAPVVEHLPDLAFRDDPARGRRITLRHVLSHTTGLPSGGKDQGASDAAALRRFVHEDLARYRFSGEPGEVHRYSNTVLVLAAHVAEVVTGRTYEDAVAEHVLAPLGMGRTTFELGVAATYPLALPHGTGGDGRPVVQHRFPQNRDGNAAGFGLGSTLDLARLGAVLVDGRAADGSVFLPEAALEELRTPWTSRHTSGFESGYGLALYTGHWRGHRAVGHGGLLASYNCLVTAFPEHGRAVVVQSCWDDGRGTGALMEVLHRWAVDGAGPSCACPPEPRPAPVRLDGLVGTWLDVHAGTVEVAEVDGRVVLTSEDRSAPVELAPDGPVWDGTPIGVVRADDGTARHLVLDGEPYQRFSPVPFDPAGDIGWVAGEYAAWDVDDDPARLEVVDGRLVVHWWMGRQEARRVGPAAFVSGYGLLELEREHGDRVVLVAGGGARLLRVPAPERVPGTGAAPSDVAH